MTLENFTAERKKWTAKHRCLQNPSHGQRTQSRRHNAKETATRERQRQTRRITSDLLSVTVKAQGSSGIVQALIVNSCQQENSTSGRCGGEKPLFTAAGRVVCYSPWKVSGQLPEENNRTAVFLRCAVYSIYLNDLGPCHIDTYTPLLLNCSEQLRNRTSLVSTHRQVGRENTVYTQG